MLELKGHNRNDRPRMETAICDECAETGHSANNCPFKFVHARHVAFEVTNYKPAICVPNTYALCVAAQKNQKATQHYFPHAECQTSKLFGHVTKDCAYANCLDVDDDWFNEQLAA